MFIDDECEGSDEESNIGDLEDVDMDGDVHMVDANAGHVDDGGIFVSEGNANATGPTVAGLIWRDHNHRVSGDADGYPHEPRLIPRYHDPRLQERTITQWGYSAAASHTFAHYRDFFFSRGRVLRLRLPDSQV